MQASLLNYFNSNFEENGFFRYNPTDFVSNSRPEISFTGDGELKIYFDDFRNLLERTKAAMRASTPPSGLSFIFEDTYEFLDLYGDNSLT
jgi:hypothetical protein